MFLKAEGNARWAKRWVMTLFAVVLGLTLVWSGAGPAEAHTTLLKAEPEASAELASPPAQVALTFNERLEQGLYYLRVYDSDKKLVTEKEAAMNDSRTVLSLDMPKLQKGVYLVTYHVISADGHPVDGSYLFAVGQALDKPGVAGGNEALEQMHQHHMGINFTYGPKHYFQFATRILFYFAMLALTGWALWARWYGNRASKAVKPLLKTGGDRLKQLYLVVYVVFMGAHLDDLLGAGGGAQAMLKLFTQTTVGYAWLGGLLLALLSFVWLGRGPWADYVFVALVWFSKSLLGHAAAFEPLQETLLLDFLHLGASAVWVGGLLLLLTLWRKHSKEVKNFTPLFSKAALYSILLLTVSGILSVLIFLPDITYVVETGWGKWLLVKTGLVVLVILTAFLIRLAIKGKQEKRERLLVRIDAALMALILAVVGIFTYMTPLPTNLPLNWHVMGETIHMTAKISPKTPGVNNFGVDVWLPGELGKPKEVQMKLRLANAPEIAPLQVPLTMVEDAAIFEDATYNMKKYSYKAKGAFLPYPGYWELEVRVMNSKDDETVYNNTFRVY